MDPDLSHMRVPAVLVVAYHSDLDHESSDRILARILHWNDDPAGRLCQVDDLDLIEVVEVSSTSDGDPRWSVGLIELVIAVNEDLADRCLPTELDVH